VISDKELIAVLVDVQHRYLRKAFQNLQTLVEARAGAGDKSAGALAPEVAATADALDRHFKEEEHNLFPKILRAGTAGPSGPADPGALGYYEVAVRDLICEHEEAKAFFDKVVAWSESLGAEHDDLSDGLVTLAVVINAHILIEEELLFPRAEAVFRS